MSVINCFKRLVLLNRYLTNVNKPNLNNLKNVTFLSAKYNNYNIYRFLSVNDENIQNKKLFYASTNLDRSVREQQRVYKTDLISVITNLEQTGVSNQENPLLLLQCCGHLMPDMAPSERFTLAQRIWQSFESKSFGFDVEHYNAMLQCYIENQKSISYKDFLAKMTCKPNEDTYQLLLRCVCERGDTTQAVEIVNVMKENGLSANERVFSSLILGHLRSSDIKSARNILSTMKFAQITPSSISNTELLRGYCELKDEFNFSTTLQDTVTSNQLNHKNLISIVRTVCDSKNLQFLPLIKRSFPNVINSRSFQVNLTTLCIHLIYSERPEIAYETYKCLVDPEVGFLSESDTYASVLLFEMAKAQTDSQKVIQISDDLIKTKRNEFATFKALECSLRVLNTNLAIELLKNIHSKKIKLRSHYFWPILIQTAKTDGQTGVFDIFRIMTELNVQIDYDTLETYSLKYIDNFDPEIVINQLKELNMKVLEVLTPISVVLLRSNNINDIINLCKRYKIKLDGQFIIKPLSNTFLSTYDVKNTINVLKCINDSKKHSSEYNGQLLSYVLNKPAKLTKYNEIINLLEGYKQNDMKITSFNMDKIEYICKRIQDETVKSKILKISSDLVDHSQINDSLVTHIPHPRDMNLEQLECHLIELNNKKMETRGVLRKLLQMHCRIGNVVRVQELLEEFQKLNYKMSVGMKAGLLDLYIKSSNLKLAQEIYKEIVEKDPTFIVDEFKVIDLANLLVVDGKFEEADKLLNTEIQKRKIRGGKTIEPNCWRLLNASAKTGNVEQTQKLFHTLTASNFCLPNNVILGPIIRVHLANDNFEGAVQQFVDCCEKYRQTPLQHELLSKLVDTKRPTELIQQVIDATSQIHGTNSAKVALTAALAETGKHNTLKEFLMEQRSDLSPFLLEQHCNRWVKEGSIEPLLNLVKARTLMSEDNQNIIYHSIMKIYHANDDWQSALALWDELQNKDYVPSENVKKILTNLLTVHNHPLVNRL